MLKISIIEGEIKKLTQLNSKLEDHPQKFINVYDFDIFTKDEELN